MLRHSGAVVLLSHAAGCSVLKQYRLKERKDPQLIVSSEKRRHEGVETEQVSHNMERIETYEINGSPGNFNYIFRPII
jgi:hypothetical protein